MDLALQMGYINVPKDLIIDLASIHRYPANKLVIITTGSQGGDHVRPLPHGLQRAQAGGDRPGGTRCSSPPRPSPGNEKSVYSMIDELFKKGADVVYEKLAEIHVSGHACQEELKMMMALTKPKYFIPVHGEYRMLRVHAGMAEKMGIPPKNIFISDIGRPIELTATGGRLANPVPAGKVLVDGLGVGDVGTAVLRDRKHLSQDGLIVVVVTLERATGRVLAGPDIISRGFIYVKEAEDLIEKLRRLCADSVQRCLDGKIRDWSTIKTTLKNDVSDYLYRATKRSPMILPVITEV